MSERAERAPMRRRTLLAGLTPVGLLGCFGADPEATLAVRVVDADDDPRAGVPVEVHEVGTVWSPGEHVTGGETDGEGVFETTLPHGEYAVWVLGDGTERDRVVTVEEGGTEIEIEFPEGG